MPLVLHALTNNAPADMGQPIALECSVSQGPWEPCQMVIMDMGSYWLLAVGYRRIFFRHDGTGHVEMKEKELWRSVKSEWQRDGTLCWGEICVRGTIPLD